MLTPCEVKVKSWLRKPPIRPITENRALFLTLCVFCYSGLGVDQNATSDYVENILFTFCYSYIRQCCYSLSLNKKEPWNC